MPFFRIRLNMDFLARIQLIEWKLHVEGTCLSQTLLCEVQKAMKSWTYLQSANQMVGSCPQGLIIASWLTLRCASAAHRELFQGCSDIFACDLMQCSDKCSFVTGTKTWDPFYSINAPNLFERKEGKSDVRTKQAQIARTRDYRTEFSISALFLRL